ncbi:hypothetical protein AMTRI_Chr02g224250 [Amborella trichopoda]
MEASINEIATRLRETMGPDTTLVSLATETLKHLSSHPSFPLSLISIITGDCTFYLKIAAATYLKNFLKANEEDPSFSKVRQQVRNSLVQVLLQVEPRLLSVLVEAYRLIITRDFVKDNSWPELVPELRSAIQTSDLIGRAANMQWKTINSLTVLQATIKPFQYFMNPQLKREPIPQQLVLIAKEILSPLYVIFHHFTEQVLLFQDEVNLEAERILYILSKCIYFAVKSHMPSALVPLLASWCGDLLGLLDSLNLRGPTSEDWWVVRMKIGKRCLQIVCALVTRHRKHADKLMPRIVESVLKLVNQSHIISELDHLAERVMAMSFDVISHILETGPGWRIVSPHFSFLLESAIFPAMLISEADVSEWNDDMDEYIRKNFPSDLGEISGWREDLFTARKSAMNLLGVMSLSKGPSTVDSSTRLTKRKKGKKSGKDKERSCSVGEMLVIPFLSKFTVPSDVDFRSSSASHDYYGVLMAYGGLQDFLKERDPEYTKTLVKSRVLPLYGLEGCSPFLIAAANWLIGELVSCLPPEISADVYNALLKALIMPDLEELSCYPVRASAAGAIAQLLENDYEPPEWFPLLQVIVNGIGDKEENEASLLFQLLKTVVEVGDEKVAIYVPAILSAITGAILKHVPRVPVPWSQVVELGFAALAALAHVWDSAIPDEKDSKLCKEWRSGCSTIAGMFSALLQEAWLLAVQEHADYSISPPSSCMEDISLLLKSILKYTTEVTAVVELKIFELLVIWADLIADWHAWEDEEDMSIFDAIKEAVHLHIRCGINGFLIRELPPPPAPPVSKRSIIEGFGMFISEAMEAYPAATWRACSCAHVLLHLPRFSFETEGTKQALAIAFCKAAFSRFLDIRSKPVALWKPLLLVVASCYMCCPDYIEKVLVQDENEGFTVWMHGLVCISARSFEPGLSSDSEIKLAVITLTKLVKHLVGLASGWALEAARECFESLLEAAIHLKELQDEDEDDGMEDVDENESDDEIEEDSEEDEHEETEEEFLERYALAARELGSGMIEEDEGDVDDETHEIELGDLGGLDYQRDVFSLIKEHQHRLAFGRPIRSELISSFTESFPECVQFFTALC